MLLSNATVDVVQLQPGFVEKLTKADFWAASSATQRSNFAMINLSTALFAKPDELHRGPVDDDHGGTHTI